MIAGVQCTTHSLRLSFSVGWQEYEMRIRWVNLLGLWCVLCMGYFVPNTQAEACQIDGTVQRNTYRSHLSQTTMYYTVYLPPCYDASQTYPTLYLLHGSASYDDHWLQLGLEQTLNEGIREGSYPEMIVILPYGEWIANENRFDSMSFENVFLTELMPDVESHFSVSTQAQLRAIGGISRGGFWAFEIAFRHPELFQSVGGHSAYFDLYHAPADNNPLDLALNAPNIEPLRIWLDRGADDFARPGLDEMDLRLMERGLTYRYTVHEQGMHDNRYWTEHLAEYLAFYTEPWETLPSVSLPDPSAFIFTAPRQLPPDPLTFQYVPPASPAKRVYLPIVAFNSTLTALGKPQWEVVLDGSLDETLILTQAILDELKSYGLELNPSLLVEDETALLERLRNNRDNWSILPFDAITLRHRMLWIETSSPLQLLQDQTYALAFNSGQLNFNPTRLTTLTVSGVTAMTRESMPALDQYGSAWASSGIADYTTQADFFHTSNEVSFVEGCPAPTDEMLGAFCSKPEYFDILKRIGTDIIELSGNHNVDYGYQAYAQSLGLYRANGISIVGGGDNLIEAQQPLLIDHHDNRIAWLSCNDVGPYYAIATDSQPGAASCQGSWLRERIQQLDGEGYFVIVTVQHTEVEDYLPPLEIQQDFSAILLWGADAVFGTQAHKPQTFEISGADAPKFIHYGLGNLFFDQDFWGNSRFFMDTLYIYENRLHTVDLFLGIIEDQARPRKMTRDEAQNFLEFMFIVHNGVRQ